FDFGSPAGDSLQRFRNSVTDADGHLHVTFLDGRTNVAAAEERIEGRVPTTRYSHDPLGQMIGSVDAAGNQTSVGYDLAGRTTAIAPPDSGLTEFRYDSAGNQIAKIDPNLRAAGLSVSYVYQFNRLVRVSRPISGDITFQYGPPGAAENAAGRFTSIVDEAGTETRGYGRLGELARTTRTVVPLSPSNP